MKSAQTSILSLGITFFILLGFTGILFAQDANEAEETVVENFNRAQELAGENEYDSAIELYREALSTAQSNQLNQHVEQITRQLPRVYSQRASAAYSAYQNEQTIPNLERAITYFEDAEEAGREFEDGQVVEQARGAIPQLYYVKSVLQYRQQDFDGALSSLDTAINMNSNYAVAYYQRAIVLKEQNPGDVETWLQWYDRAIDVAESVGDNRTLNNATNAARDELIYRAVTLKDNRQYSAAIELLNRVSDYDPQSADAQYRFAEIYNEQGNWSAAEQHARRALEYETGGVTARAKIYFELGTALKGQGNFTEACEAFENAAYGQFTEPANHELRFELRCEGHTP